LGRASTGGWYGQLGSGKQQMQADPRELAELKHIDVRSVSCGYYHTLSVTTHYCDIMSRTLGSDEVTGQERACLNKLLVSGDETFLRKYSQRGYEKLCRDRSLKRPPLSRVLSLVKKEQFSLPPRWPRLEVSQLQLRFGVQPSKSFPIATKLTEAVTITNRNASAVSVKFDRSQDMNALAGDFDLNVEGCCVLRPGQSKELTVNLEVHMDTCDDIVFHVDIVDGVSTMFVVKVKSNELKQKDAWKAQLQPSPGEFLKLAQT